MRKRSTRRVAIWIDHREAILVAFVGDDLAKQQELLSDAGPHTHGGGSSQHRFDAHRHEMLRHFYEEVVDHLGPVDEILILGPGEAKHELCKRIEHHKGLKGRVKDVVSADKLTENELLKRVEDAFF
jgi:peptide subunit release factor 1 (eRF1)